MKILRISIILLFTLTAFAMADWISQTVAANGDVGNYCSIQVDHYGLPHVAYFDKTNSLVVYGRYNGSSWTLETVATGVTLMGNISLAFDSTERPYIVFWDSTSKDLLLYSKSGTTWASDKVGNGSGYGIVTSLAITGAGPVIAFTSGAAFNTQVRYAYRDTSWHVETASTNSSSGQFMSMCIDAGGTPHIVHSDGARGVVHTMRSGTTWASPIIIGAGADCDVTYGPDNNMHVAYSGTNGAGLIYAKSSTGNTWITEIVLPTTTITGFPHIVLNGNGQVFISYFDWTTHDLHLVYKDSGSWTNTLVAGERYIGNSNDLAVNGLRAFPLVAYYDNDPGDMKVAHYEITGIRLRSFSARRVAEGVDVAWALNTNEGIAGFNIYRATAPGNLKRERLNAELITGASPYLFRDSGADHGVVYRYWLEAVDLGGKAERFGPITCETVSKPAAFALEGNYPNPARGKTSILFTLPAAAAAELSIYDISGRRVATPFVGPAGAGPNTVAVDVSGFAPGVYTYRLRAGENEALKKMLVVE